MSITSFDLELHSMIKYGLDYLRQHPETFDEIFANFNNDHFKNLYGDKEIEKIKTWYSNNDLPVVLGFNFTPQHVPGYSIHLASSQEQMDAAFFADHAGYEEFDKEQPRIIIAEFVPISYDKILHIVEVPENIDLNLVRVGHIVKDANNNNFPIFDITDQKLTLVVDDIEPDMSKARIESFITKDIKRRGEIYMIEQVDIGVHGHGGGNIVLWMYYILIYILLRFKPILEQRDLELSTFSASDFNKDAVYIAENVYSRWIRFSARTRISWTEEPLQQIDTLVVEIENKEDC